MASCHSWSGKIEKSIIVKQSGDNDRDGQKVFREHRRGAAILAWQSGWGRNCGRWCLYCIIKSGQEEICQLCENCGEGKVFQYEQRHEVGNSKVNMGTKAISYRRRICCEAECQDLKQLLDGQIVLVVVSSMGFIFQDSRGS